MCKMLPVFIDECKGEIAGAVERVEGSGTVMNKTGTEVQNVMANVKKVTMEFL